MNKKTIMVAAIAAAISGCAHIEFGKDATNGDGLIYFEPQPYLLVQQDKDCAITASSIVLPGERKQMIFKTGYGAGGLSASLSNGMIASVGQDSTSGVNETITAVAALAAVVAAAPAETSAMKGVKPVPSKDCPSAFLYPIEKKGVLGKRIPIIPPPPPES